MISESLYYFEKERETGKKKKTDGKYFVCPKTVFHFRFECFIEVSLKLIQELAKTAGETPDFRTDQLGRTEIWWMVFWLLKLKRRGGEGGNIT